MKFIATIFLMLFSISVMAQELPNAPTPVTHSQNYFKNHTNQVLIGSEFSIRTLDAWSTRTGIKAGYEEGGTFFGLASLKPVAAHTSTQYAYSLGMASVYTGVSAYLWHRGNTSRHSVLYHTASRLLIGSDLWYDGKADVNNLRIIY